MATRKAKSRARGHVCQRGGTWSVVLTVPDPTTGLPKRKWYSGFKDADAAEKKRTELLRQLDTGAWTEPNRVTVGAYATAWLALKQPGLAAKTAERYGEIIARFIAPGLGGLRLQKLRAGHVRTFYEQARAGTLALPPAPDGKTPRPRRPLAPRTVRHVAALLREILEDAVRDGDLVVNPAGHIRPAAAEGSEAEPLAADRVVAADDDEQDAEADEARTGDTGALDEGQATRLMAAAHGHALEPLVIVALGTGLRRGELLGLAWSAVNLARGTLAVRRSLEVTRAGGYRLKRPKTKRSRRTLTLPALAVETLRRHKVAQAKARLAAGPAWHEHGLVFTREDGRPLNPSWTSKTVTALARAAGLPEWVTLHTARHSHASLLLAAGVPLPAVSARLGHANVAITAAIYAHALPQQDAAAAATVDAVLRATGRPAPGRGGAQ